MALEREGLKEQRLVVKKKKKQSLDGNHSGKIE